MDGLQGNTVKSLRHHARLTAQAPSLALPWLDISRTDVQLWLGYSRAERIVRCPAKVRNEDNGINSSKTS